MMQSRRDVLHLSAGAIALAATGSLAAAHASAQPGLKEAARGKGIEVGSAFNGWFHPPLEALLVENCNIITPENALKAANISSEDGRSLTPGAMDDIAAFCARHDLKLHGHALFWHQSLPAWLRSNDLDEAKRTHLQHLRFVMSRYPDATSWDVVNEVMSDDERRYREVPILESHGDEFIAFLFRTARALAPDARLVINDYNLSCGASFCGAKRARMLLTLERLLRANVPIDALGIQAHLVPRWPVVPASLRAFLRDVGELGLAIYITELDVNDVDLPDDVAKRDQAIAHVYGDFLDVALDFPSVKRVSFWGLTDKYHWIVEGYAPFKRTGGAPRPALFDQEFRPKPAYSAVRDALSRARPR